MKKLSKNNGFTIVEMLIVVAIIAILIAISIPMFTAALERTRHAVDDANIRDAISLGNIEYLTNQNNTAFMNQVKESGGKQYVYQVDDGSTDSSNKDYQGHLLEVTAGTLTTAGVGPKCTGNGTPECKDGTYKSTGNLVVTIAATDGDIQVTAEFK